MRLKKWPRPLAFSGNMRYVLCMDLAIKYRGKTINADDVTFIKSLIAENPRDSRFALSIKLCKAWNWVQKNGALKDMVCRGLMLQLHRADHIKLPARKRPPVNPLSKRKKPDIVRIEKTSLITTLKAVRPLKFMQVRRTPSEKVFNSLIDQYHYLGYCQPVGEHLKYIICAKNKPIACMVFGAAPHQTPG